MRLSREEYYWEILEAVRKRGTCDRGQNGALIISPEGRVLTTGYVGSPPGEPHCDEVGHLIEVHSRIGGGIFVEISGALGYLPNRESLHCVRTIHAEMNAILQAARYGTPINGCIIYTYMFPCFTCAKAIVSVGIKRVLARYDYQKSEDSKELFNAAGVEWKCIGPVETYPKSQL